MKYTLPELPYNRDALLPYLSPEAFDYHYDKHHAAYVNKLNDLIQGTEYEEKDLNTIIIDSFNQKNMPIFNNAAQHWNHSFFWNCMSPSGTQPSEQVLELINKSFGSFEAFKEKFSNTALTIFGSGWAWLTIDDNFNMEIMGLSNAETPLVHGKKPILTLDVWEHAYYIDYRNARPKFIESFWNIVNWDHVNNHCSKV